MLKLLERFVPRTTARPAANSFGECSRRIGSRGPAQWPLNRRAPVLEATVNSGVRTQPERAEDALPYGNWRLRAENRIRPHTRGG